MIKISTHYQTLVSDGKKKTDEKNNRDIYEKLLLSLSLKTAHQAGNAVHLCC